MLNVLNYCFIFFYEINPHYGNSKMSLVFPKEFILQGSELEWKFIAQSSFHNHSQSFIFRLVDHPFPSLMKTEGFSPLILICAVCKLKRINYTDILFACRFADFTESNVRRQMCTTDYCTFEF